MSKKIFITGTGTDIGKTYIAALIVKKLHEAGVSSAYYKAAVSGNERDTDGSLIPGDAAYVKEISGTAQPVSEMCPYIYEAAFSPHLASRLEGNPVDMERVLAGLKDVCGKYDFITAEGSGGILCPLRFDGTSQIMLEDFIKAGDFSCLMAADAGLGTINNVVLTYEYMKQKNIPLKGIIFNNYEEENILHRDNKEMCERLTGLKVIACVKRNDTDIDIDADFLMSLYD